jgi:hypothetical protein
MGEDHKFWMTDSSKTTLWGTMKPIKLYIIFMGNFSVEETRYLQENYKHRNDG